MKGQRGVVPGLAIRIGHLHGGVTSHAHGLGRNVASLDDQRDSILTRQHERSVVAAAAEATTATSAASLRRRRKIRRVDQRLVSQIPIHPIDPGVARVT